MILNSKQNDYRVLSFLSDMRMSEETYERLKSIFHPKIRKNIGKFKKENYIIFPLYHGCGKRNRNGTNKKINYAVGEMCKSATYLLSSKSINDLKWKHLPHKIYFTRYGGQYGLNNFAKRKGGKWFDWDKKEFLDKKPWIEIEKNHYCKFEGDYINS